MPKDVYQFSCPCCGKEIEIDTRSGHARAIKPEEKKGGGDLDKLLGKHQQESRRLADVFEAAKEQQQRQRELLDQALEKAKTEAKKDKDQKPLNPFDFE